MTDSDRFKKALAGFVRQVFSRIDYLALHQGKVESQDGQSVDVSFDSPTMPDLAGVPLCLGVPGLEVDVAAGSRVLVGFAGGDPTKPQAYLWNAGDALQKLRVKAGTETVFSDGTLEVARKTDPTGTGTLSMLAVSGGGSTAITFLWTPEGGGAPVTVGTIALTTAGGTATAGTPAALAGKITGGASKVKA